MLTSIARNRDLTEEALTAAAFEAHDKRLLGTQEVNQLIRGRATPAVLQSAKLALAANEKLAAMTAPGAPDSSATLQAAAIGFIGPKDFAVTVTGDKVEAASNRNDVTKFLFITRTNTSSLQIETSRADAHAAATTAVAAAKRVVGAIEGQLAAQVGVETALYGVMARTESLIERIKGF
ncbi:MAG: hypothetical protein ACAI38_08870 [Myxococcota bacterium]